MYLGSILPKRVTLFGLLIVLGTGAHASTFTDGFEAAVLDPFWSTLQQNGSITLSTNRAHTGAQSAYFQSTSGGQRSMNLFHQFAQPVKGDFSVFFYDVAPGQQTLYELIALSNSADPNSSAGIGTQDFDAFCYAASAAGGGPNANCGSSPQVSTTNIPRTLGWHEFKISVGATSISEFIDGILVYTTLGNFTIDRVDLAVFGPGFRPNTNASFDDFNATFTSVPEPGGMALAGVAFIMLGLCRRFRRNSPTRASPKSPVS